VWDAKISIFQIRIESKMPSAESIAAGAAAAAVAGGVAAGMRDNADTTTSTAVPEQTSSSDWHEAHHVSVTQDVDPPERVRVPDRVTMPGRSTAGSTTSPVPQQPVAASQLPDPSPETPPIPTAGSLSEAVEAFAATRMLSERNQLKELHKGRSQEVSIRINSIERTFGIGIPDSYRGGSTLIAEAEGGEVEIRLPADLDTSEYHAGTEASLKISIADWNAVRRRLVLEAQ
jgi:hypothetical protein